MKPTAKIPNWQETKMKLAEKTAEERLFDGMGNLVANFIREKEEETEKYKFAYEQEKAKNERLIAIIKAHGIDFPEFGSTTINLPLPQRTNKSQKSFTSLLQVDNKNDILAKLHDKIDGKGGKDVAMVLLKAKENTIISRTPCQTEFESEFPNYKGTWRAISSYFSGNKYIDISSVVI